MLDEIVTWQGLLSQGTRRMDEGMAGTRGVEGARERGRGGEEKRDLSGKSERDAGNEAGSGNDQER